MNRASLRADAAGNRARIIAAARAAIADAGEVKLNAIARQAGVGQGTLYRHFPTREDLLAEVYREDVDALVAAAPALLAEHEPFTALACWLDRVADYAQVKRGVFAALEAAVSQDLAAHSHGRIGAALTALLDAGKADGTIRPDVDARDVILLIGYLTRLEQAEWDARARHLLQVVLDGLRHHDQDQQRRTQTGSRLLPANPEHSPARQHNAVISHERQSLDPGGSNSGTRPGP